MFIESAQPQFSGIAPGNWKRYMDHSIGGPGIGKTEHKYPKRKGPHVPPSWQRKLDQSIGKTEHKYPKRKGMHGLGGPSDTFNMQGPFGTGLAKLDPRYPAQPGVGCPSCDGYYGTPQLGGLLGKIGDIFKKGWEVVEKQISDPLDIGGILGSSGGLLAEILPGEIEQLLKNYGPELAAALKASGIPHAKAAALAVQAASGSLHAFEAQKALAASGINYADPQVQQFSRELLGSRAGEILAAGGGNTTAAVVVTAGVAALLWWLL